MSEEKIIIPAYVRIGICKECGADVYAPQGSGLPHMSACSCLAGREVTITRAETSKLLAVRTAESDPEKKTKAA